MIQEGDDAVEPGTGRSSLQRRGMQPGRGRPDAPPSATEGFGAHHDCRGRLQSEDDATGRRDRAVLRGRGEGPGRALRSQVSRNNNSLHTVVVVRSASCAHAIHPFVVVVVDVERDSHKLAHHRGPAARVVANFGLGLFSLPRRYNFDVARGLPLGAGRYEWTPVASGW